MSSTTTKTTKTKMTAMKTNMAGFFFLNTLIQKVVLSLTVLIA